MIEYQVSVAGRDTPELFCLITDLDVGFGWRRSAAVGVLMNSRGLTELIVLQVGLSLGILSDRLASMMIIMALATTIAATPLFRRVYAGRLEREDSIEPVLAQVMPTV